MKLIKKNLRNKEFVLKIDNNDDLWELSSFVEPGDVVVGKATRKIKIGENTVKKTITSTLEVEKVSFDTSTLRINGITLTEHEDIPKGSHQSIGVSIDEIVTIRKEHLLKLHIDRIEEMVNRVKTSVLIVAFDKDEALLINYALKSFNILYHIKSEGNKKHYLSSGDKTKAAKDFFEDISLEIEKLDQSNNYDTIVLASSEFWKNKLLTLLNEKDSIKKKIITAKISNVSMAGINELIKDSGVVKLLKNNEVLKDTHYVERLMTEIAKNGLYAYGFEEVKHYVDNANADLLLVTTQYLHENKKNIALMNLLRFADNINCEVHIVDSKNEPGMKLDSLGHIAVILRYKQN